MPCFARVSGLKKHLWFKLFYGYSDCIITIRWPLVTLLESAHKQVVHARLRQAGMRWSEAGARRLLALRLLLLNGDWALLDRLRMVSLA